MKWQPFGEQSGIEEGEERGLESVWRSLLIPSASQKKLLREKRSGLLACLAEEVNTFLHDTLSDPVREQELEANRALINPAPPTTMLELRQPSLKAVEEITKAARCASSSKPQRCTIRCVQNLSPVSASPLENLEGHMA